MCFSAGASFGAGVLLSVIGVASVKKTSSSSQLIFASIPFVVNHPIIVIFRLQYL